MKLLIDINEIEQDVPHRPGKLYKFDFKSTNRANGNGWVSIFKK